MKRILIGLALVAGIAGVGYLATLGCCQLISRKSAPASLGDQLQLTPSQRQGFAALERDFLARKQASCGMLCAKRAHLIQLLKQDQPDLASLGILAEEIGQEQIALERATLEHLVKLQEGLEPSQRERLVALVTEKLRAACEMTACGASPGCFVKEGDKKQ
ncbi:MAG: periplasmic heavy metal sensor [Candidatus Omnitrophica bacterium]|nr:periplasmic heavy metal sensor [Candidatus Omnitrophota bacterium]